jgi:hypothetical protein
LVDLGFLEINLSFLRIAKVRGVRQVKKSLTTRYLCYTKCIAKRKKNTVDSRDLFTATDGRGELRLVMGKIRAEIFM